ncbi:MAG: chemotaxis protein CheB, partial [Pseudomonadota bacterium]
MTTQVLVVDDSVAARQTLSELIDEQPDMCVMGTASDPFKAVELIKRRVPDVIVLDIEMPRMDGLSFLRRIMAQRPIPVIICSTQVEAQNPVAIEALRAGAVDVAHKPKVPSRAMFEECQVGIVEKIRAAARVKMTGQRSTRASASGAQTLTPQEKLTADAILPQRALRIQSGTRKPLIAIGASTGGTQAIEALFKQLNPAVHSIVVVQHMPEHFTAAFARRLNAVSAIDVKEAANGDELRPGLALIAPGGVHLIVRPHANGYVCQTMPGPLVS